MKSVILGFDTSNYRTSAAAVTAEGEVLLNERKLLPVAEGERGLRQSDAVFIHLKQMDEVTGKLRDAVRGNRIVAVGIQNLQPRYEEIFVCRRISFQRLQ